MSSMYKSTFTVLVLVGTVFLTANCAKKSSSNNGTEPVEQTADTENCELLGTCSGQDGALNTDTENTVGDQTTIPDAEPETDPVDNSDGDNSNPDEGEEMNPDMNAGQMAISNLQIAESGANHSTYLNLDGVINRFHYLEDSDSGKVIVYCVVNNPDTFATNNISSNPDDHPMISVGQLMMDNFNFVDIGDCN